jgi:hypothetical protein
MIEFVEGIKKEIYNKFALRKLLCIVQKYPSAHPLLGPMLLVMSYPVTMQEAAAEVYSSAYRYTMPTGPVIRK